MALPKIDLPIYELKLPSNDKKVKYRPFTVKEEKILLISQETKDPAQIINSVKQVVNNCLIDYDIEDLALFDLEYLLINIRAKSIDNIVKFKIEDPDTKDEVQLELDLNNVKVERDDKHTNRIKLNDTYTLFLKYPSIDVFFDFSTQEKPSAEKNLEIMLSCMDRLVSEEDVYNFKDFTKKEVDNFIESLHADSVKKLKEFFDTIPKIRHEIPYRNKAGEDKTFVIQGTQTFFI
jgi:T4 bacteriophage base plate protein